MLRQAVLDLPTRVVFSFLSVADSDQLRRLPLAGWLPAFNMNQAIARG